MYDDLTYSFWVTPEGESETLIANKVGWAAWGLGQAFRGAYFADPNSVLYWDNTVQYWINPHSQGFPNIYKAPGNIVVDGNIDLVNEWAGATKVASKEAGKVGNFIPWVAGGRTINLSDNTVVDTYMTYDANYFYIAAISNNITSGQFSWFDNGRMDIRFVFDDPNHNSYGFTATATGADPCSDANHSLAFQNYNGYPESVSPVPAVIDINDFYNDGGRFWYTYSSGTKVMKVELKIPFTWMPDFNGIEAGKEVELFFVVCETGNGRRGTTHQIGEVTPYFPFSLHSRERGQSVRTPGVGIRFPVCGEDYPYPAGDLNEDCRVNFLDLGLLAEQWLKSSPPIGDLHLDGIVDFRDYAILADNWQACDDVNCF